MRGSTACSSDHHPVRLVGPTVWRKRSGDLKWHWLSGARRMLSWRPCGHLLHLFGIWYWVKPADYPHWVRLYLWRRRRLRTRLTPRPPMESSGELDLHSASSCRIFTNRSSSWSCSGPGRMQAYVMIKRMPSGAW
jgi:hypothetical protein